MFYAHYVKNQNSVEEPYSLLCTASPMLSFHPKPFIHQFQQLRKHCLWNDWRQMKLLKRLIFSKAMTSVIIFRVTYHSTSTTYYVRTSHWRFDNLYLPNAMEKKVAQVTAVQIYFNVLFTTYMFLCYDIHSIFDNINFWALCQFAPIVSGSNEVKPQRDHSPPM